MEEETKSLWELGLESVEWLREADESNAAEDRASSESAPNHLTDLAKLVTKRSDFANWLEIEGKSLANLRKITLETSAWQCEGCQVINGFQSKSWSIRKTCSKCKKPRLETRPLIEILAEEFKS